MRFLRLFLPSLLMLLVASPVFAGKGWELTYQVVSEGSKSVVKVLVDEENVWVTPEGKNEEVWITSEGFNLIRHDEKQIMQITFEGMGQAQKGISDAMSKMQEQMAKAMEEAGKEMDPEQAKQMKEYMNQQFGGAAETEDADSRYEIKRAGGGGKVAGLDTEKIDAYEDGEQKGSAWVTDAIPTAVLINAARNIQKNIQKAAGGMMGGETQLFDFVKSMDGWPLKITGMDANGEGMIEATAASKRSFGPKDWKGPEGYETSNPMEMMRQGMETEEDSGGW